MSNAENSHIPRQEQRPADVVEYGPDVPLAERLERAQERTRERRHDRQLMYAD